MVYHSLLFLKKRRLGVRYREIFQSRTKRTLQWWQTKGCSIRVFFFQRRLNLDSVMPSCNLIYKMKDSFILSWVTFQTLPSHCVTVHNSLNQIVPQFSICKIMITLLTRFLGCCKSKAITLK